MRHFPRSAGPSGVISTRWLVLVGALALGQVSEPGGLVAQEDAWLAKDKAEHFAASAIIAAGTYAFAIPLWECKQPRALLATGVSLSAGLLKEWSDSRGRGQASWKDLAWDVLGVAAGVGLLWGFDDAPAACGPPPAGGLLDASALFLPIGPFPPPIR
ncbi:MAG: hypothetical protein R3E10_13910 [Gemmatimonadota bacterium]